MIKNAISLIFNGDFKIWLKNAQFAGKHQLWFGELKNSGVSSIPQSRKENILICNGLGLLLASALWLAQNALKPWRKNNFLKIIRAVVQRQYLPLGWVRLGFNSRQPD